MARASERRNPCAFQLLTDDDTALCIDAVDLKSDFAMSRPIAVIACMLSSSGIVVASTATNSKALARPLGGAVHSINSDGVRLDATADMGHNRTCDLW